jgi:hypothetical protein
MEKDINKMIEDGFKLAQKHEQIRQEMLNDVSLPQEMKEELVKLNQEFEEQRLKDEKYIEDNKHRKILGYNPDTFMPIYEDEK